MKLFRNFCEGLGGAGFGVGGFIPYHLTVLVNDDVPSVNYIDLDLKGIYSCNSRMDGVFLMSIVHCIWYIKG